MPRSAVTRYEVPSPSEYSWRVGERTVRVYIGPHSVDPAWPWWRPGLVLEQPCEDRPQEDQTWPC